MTVLHINSSARTTQSNSRIIGQYLVERLNETTINRDLTAQPLPVASAEDLMGVHGSSTDERESLKQQLAISDELIAELKTADTLVIGTAMYNFGVPAVLKQWIDAICRSGVSFKYGANGPEGLLGVDTAYIITATGGTPVGSSMDFASPYLAHICRFIGIKNIHQIDASGSKGAPEVIIAAAKAQIDTLLAEQK